MHRNVPSSGKLTPYSTTSPGFCNTFTRWKSEVRIHKVDEPYVVVNLLDADGLSSKDLAEINCFVAQADAATASDHDGFIG